MGLWYSKDYGFELIAYSDADLAGCYDDCKSTSGGIQFLGDKLVSWSSKNARLYTMSTRKLSTISLICMLAKSFGCRMQLLDYEFWYNKIPMTEYQLADLFTKALPKKFEYLVHMIGMRCMTPTELERLAKLSS
ncbi:hypothetical protein Tco_0577835 [Tanacetum coccineum]